MSISINKKGLIHLYALSLIIICMEAFLLIKEDDYALSRDVFVLSAISFFFFFCILDYIFKLYVCGSAAALFSLLPAVLLFLLLKNTDTSSYPGAAVIAAAAARAFFVFVPARDSLLLYGVFPLDAAAACLYFAGHVLGGSHLTDKLLFICLVILTLSSLQKLFYERNRDAFPFHYFILIGIILTTLPMNTTPIDWTPVANAGEKLIRKITNAADNMSYYMSSFSDNDTYAAGYNALDLSGGQINRSGKTQLILRTKEAPYYLYKDSDTGETMKVRRTIYLAGGRGTDGEQLVSFLRLMHDHGADRQYAALFSKIANVTVEYVYLDTADEIAPAHSIRLYDGDRKIESGMADIASRFLFETKTGYCVHYTSSMVMLLRLAGIPARAVAGYRYVYPFDQEDFYEVSGANAHVWPEAYLKNVGWVPFEPTTVLRTASDYTWHGASVGETQTEPEYPAEVLPSPAADPGSEKKEEPSALSAFGFFKIVLPMILAIVGLLATLIAGTIAVSWLRYRFGTPEKKLETDVEQIKKNIRRQSAEDFADRGLLSDYVDRAPSELQSDIRKVFAAYYRMLYGNDSTAEISPEENELAAVTSKRLQTAARERRKSKS